MWLLVGNHELELRGDAYDSNTGTLVSESLVSGVVVLIGTADTGVSDLNEDLLRTNLAGGGGLDDLATLSALVDGERRHV